MSFFSLSLLKTEYNFILIQFRNLCDFVYFSEEKDLSFCAKDTDHCIVLCINCSESLCRWLQDLTLVSANAVAYLSLDVSLAVSK